MPPSLLHPLCQAIAYCWIALILQFFALGTRVSPTFPAISHNPHTCSTVCHLSLLIGQSCQSGTVLLDCPSTPLHVIAWLLQLDSVRPASLIG